MSNFRTQKRPLAIDLFSGCGGFSLGLEAAGFDVVASVEINPIHCLVHHFNFPYGATICQDITKVKPTDILSQIKAKGFDYEIDLIAGGPPCQGFSLMGKRQLNDSRNNLVFQYLRIIREIQPKYFLFENVLGIKKGEHRHFLEKLITLFAENGYNLVQPISVLNAADFGVPQNRQRLILMGYRQDMPQPQYPDADSKKSVITKDVLMDLADIPCFVGKDEGIDNRNLNYKRFRENYGFENNSYFSLCHHRSNFGKVWGHIGSKHQLKTIERFQATPQGKIEKLSRFFRLPADGLSNTLRAGTPRSRGAFTAPRPIHYQHARCITVREAARLHGFPDWFQFHRTIWHGFREIGNAVVPFVAKALAEEIIKCLDINLDKIEIATLQNRDEKTLTFNMSQACEYWNIPDDAIAKRKRNK